MVRAAGTTRELILDAARLGLVSEGYAGLSTRKVADGAAVPLSQLHYHFGGKQQLLLSVLERENARLLERQAQMYGEERPLAERYEQACDFLDEDLESGYVRILQEMVAAGWSDAGMGRDVLALLARWMDLLEQVSQEAEERLGSFGPLTARDVGTLVGLAFLGAEQMILLGDDRWSEEVRGALRRVGELIRLREENGRVGAG